MRGLERQSNAQDKAKNAHGAGSNPVYKNELNFFFIVYVCNFFIYFFGFHSLC